MYLKKKKKKKKEYLYDVNVAWNERFFLFLHNLINVKLNDDDDDNNILFFLMHIKTTEPIGNDEEKKNGIVYKQTAAANKKTKNESAQEIRMKNKKLALNGSNDDNWNAYIYKLARRNKR